jgi:SAM-dependent methyltransferase
MSAEILQFDRMYAATDDPWGYRVRWYEERKRAVLLSALSRRGYDSAIEIGCGNGETTLALAPRCQALLALDASERAIAIATRRLSGHTHVELRQAVLPADWPDETYDLVVVSEMAYYLSEADLKTLLDHVELGLAEGAELVFCHWRHQIVDCAMNGDQVHGVVREWARTLSLNTLVTHVEPDFVIDVLIDDTSSIAEREGLT